MTELLPLPKVNTRTDIDDSPQPTPVELNDEKLSSILTNLVRKKYFDFLEKLLADNYENSVTGGDLSCQDIRKCAEYLEFKAVRSCMILHLYRESILNIFTEIRSDTAQKKLNVNLSTDRIFQRKTRRNVQIQTDLRPIPAETNHPPKRKHLRNVRVQTDFVYSNSGTSSDYTMSLDEKIRMFEKKFRDEDQFAAHSFPTKKIDYQNRFKEHRKRRHSSISLESPHSSLDSSIHRSVERTDSTDNEGQLPKADTTHSMSATPYENVEIPVTDTVAQEMMAMFGDDEETDIFGEVIGNVDSGHSGAVHVELSDKVNETDTALVHMVETVTDRKLEHTRDYTNELKNSIWPCELHMQRMKLHRALLKKADKGFRYSEKLRRKFEDFFGPEDDDEDDNSFAPYSPTVELDEILMSSCKKRIAPWIVKHLQPMSDGRIENRFRFKRVARHIAEKIILRNQYPNEEQIKRAIADFFQAHAVGSVDDIT